MKKMYKVIFMNPIDYKNFNNSENNLSSENNYKKENTIPLIFLNDNVYDDVNGTSQQFYDSAFYPIKNESRIDVEKFSGDIVSVFDVASYILKKIGSCSTMKLHKLLYYSQAWNLVWEDKPLFKEKIEAWANGPVVRELFNFHRGMYVIKYSDLTLGNEDLLQPVQKSNIDEVLNFYGEKSSQWLIDQTHLENPWINARKGLSPYERGYTEITLEDMFNYYSSL